MAKISFQLIPDGMDNMLSKSLTSGDRYQFSTIRRKPVSVPRKKLVALTQKSLMPQAKIQWATLTTEQKNAWVSASAFGHDSGWQLFFTDYCARVQNALALAHAPSDIVQYKVGHVDIASPATGILLEQVHPLTYWVNKKVSGSRDQYAPVKITEDFALPLQISVSYKTSLVTTDDDAFVKMYAVVLSNYQGRDIYTNLEINFDLRSDWVRVSQSLSTVLGAVKSYSVFIEAQSVQGFFEFDNVSIFHSSQNWARDPKCNNINQEFTKAFYQIPAHWAPVVLDSGAYYYSIYYDLPMVDNSLCLPFKLGVV